MFKPKTESSLWTIVSNKPIAVKQQNQLTVLTRIIRRVGDSLHMILDLCAQSQKHTDTEKKAWGGGC